MWRENESHCWGEVRYLGCTSYLLVHVPPRRSEVVRRHVAGRRRYIDAASHLLRLPNCVTGEADILAPECGDEARQMYATKAKRITGTYTMYLRAAGDATHSYLRYDYTSQCWRHLSLQEIIFRYRKTKARPPAIDAPFRESE